MVMELVKENVCLVLQCVTFANTAWHIFIHLAHNLNTPPFNCVERLLGRVSLSNKVLKTSRILWAKVTFAVHGC